MGTFLVYVAMATKKAIKETRDKWTSYADSLEEWKKSSDEKQQFVTWIQTSLPGVAKKISLPVQEDGFRYLDVGSGDGKRCCALLEVLLKTHPQVSCRSVEPLAAEQRLFKELVSEKDLRGVKFEWVEQRTEDYEKRPNAADDVKFHLVTMLQVIVVVDDPERTIMHYHDNEMERGSVMIISTVSDDTPLFKCEPLLTGLRTFKVKPSADVQQILEKNNLNYTKDFIPYHLSVTNCFDDSSRQGSLLLEMITLVPGFRERAGSDVQKKVLGVLQSYSDKRDDEIFAKFGFDVYIIYK